jgi:serine/threonine protein kinase
MLPCCVQALADVHRHGFIHRDVKTENFCLDVSGSNDTVKIIDFGFARVAYGERQRLAYVFRGLHLQQNSCQWPLTNVLISVPHD